MKSAAYSLADAAGKGIFRFFLRTAYVMFTESNSSPSSIRPFMTLELF
jgi:hypothetical protein